MQRRRFVDVRQQRGLVPDLQTFYAEYVTEHGQFHRNPPAWKAAILRWLPYASYREWRFWRRHLPHGGRWLDLGCARGRQLFLDRADTLVGADLALPALHDCPYPLATQALTDRLPFADASFDCVVSSHVLGHIPPEAKPATFREIARVLRPGGQTLHLIETDSTHPLIERAKQHPDLYQKHFIDPDGHIGLERADIILDRFQSAGLEVQSVVPIDFGPWLPRVILKHFDNDYTRHDGHVADQVRWARKVQANALKLALTDFRHGLHHQLNHAKTDPDQAPYVAIAATKP